MNWFSRSWQSLWNSPLERWGNDWFIIDPASDFSEFTTDVYKIRAVFSNPAVLKVFKLQCDMYSLNKKYVYRDEKVVKNDPLLTLLRNPNPFQAQEQFDWDYMFWKMIGNAYCYVDSDSVQSENNKLYFLDPSKMTFPPILQKFKDKIILSDALLNELNDSEIEYRYDDGTSIKIKWGRITHVSDLSNGTGNWFKGRSTIDSLYEIIANSKASIRSKNINVKYAGKYMVAGKADPSNVTQMPLGADEKESIESKMNGMKTVHAVKSMIDIKRFIENAAIIGDLDESFFSDYFKIGSMFGIKKEVLDASLNGATYENQAEATGAYVEFTLAPSANLLLSALAKRFKYTTKELIASWDHLSFMQLFEKRRAETTKLKVETMERLVKMGITIDEINVILDTNFTTIDYDRAERTSQSRNNSQNQSNN